MAKVISEINGSGLFAQSANSASTAIFDKNGKDIAETYLTAHQSLDGLMSANSLEYNTEGQISGYNGSAFAGGGSEGKTYEGIAPIVVDNVNNTISADSIDVTEIDIGDGLKLENNTLSLTATIPSTAGLMKTSNLEKNSENLITAYDGVQFAGGGTGDGDMKTSLLEYNAANQISAYNGSAFAGGQDLSDNFDLSAVAGIELTVDEDNKKVKVAVTGKEDKITYGYNDNKIISINGSALSAGAVYTGETPVIVDSTTNEISLDTVTASELEIGEGLKVEDGVISVTGGISDIHDYLKVVSSKNITLDSTYCSGGSITCSLLSNGMVRLYGSIRFNNVLTEKWEATKISTENSYKSLFVEEMPLRTDWSGYCNCIGISTNGELKIFARELAPSGTVNYIDGYYSYGGN